MKDSTELKELKALVEAHRGEKDERLHLAKRKEEHRRVMSEVGSDDINDPRVQKAMGDATLGLALVEARLAKLAVPNRLFDRIDSLHNVERRRYNEAVMAARDAAFETLIKSQLPFFEGDERACREYWKRVNPRHPMFYKFERAYRTRPSGPRDERDVVREVCSFLEAKERWAKVLNLD